MTQHPSSPCTRGDQYSPTRARRAVEEIEAFMVSVGYTEEAMADVRGLTSGWTRGVRQRAARRAAERICARTAAAQALGAACSATRNQLGSGRGTSRAAAQRSSKRSGDSGDDDPGEPEPPSRTHLRATGGAA